MVQDHQGEGKGRSSHRGCNEARPPAACRPAHMPHMSPMSPAGFLLTFQAAALGALRAGDAAATGRSHAGLC